MIRMCWDIQWFCSHTRTSTYVVPWIKWNAHKMHFSFEVTVSYLLTLWLTILFFKLRYKQKYLIQCLPAPSAHIYLCHQSKHNVLKLVHIFCLYFCDYPFGIYTGPRLCVYVILRRGGLQNQDIKCHDWAKYN